MRKVPTAAKLYPYPKGGRFCENNFLKLLIVSQHITEGRSLIFGKRVFVEKSATFEDKGYFADDDTSSVSEI